MKKNVGRVDGIIRLIIALVLIVFVFTRSTFGFIEGLSCVAAACLTYNFLFSHCYGWRWLGISTYPEDQSEDTKPP